MTDSVALTVTGTVGDLVTLNAPSIVFGTFSAGSLSATAATGGITQTGALTVGGDVEPDGFDLGAGDHPDDGREVADGRGDVVDKWDSRDGERDGQPSR